MDNIGQWTRRVQKDRIEPQGAWHKIESVINGDYLVTCGKYFAPETKTGPLEITPDPYAHEGMAPRLCKTCNPGGNEGR